MLHTVHSALYNQITGGTEGDQSGRTPEHAEIRDYSLQLFASTASAVFQTLQNFQ